MMSIRLLILSDTHDDAFPDTASMPKVDVVLHCGDLTMIGGLSNYKKAIAHIQEIDAEIKLVIAGNHDVSLDPKWWAANIDEDDDPDEPGTHSFTLTDSCQFTVYASPYTPEFNGYAWSYALGEDRFSQDAESPMPREGLDIDMTHGPPSVPWVDYQLDTSASGSHCGCPMLFEAIRRTMPKLHCFGHLHEGYGVQTIEWGGGEGVLGKPSSTTEFVEAEDGKTALVNAAIMGGQGKNNGPWVVDMRLT
ncbi:Ser/Thr protein phosphatase family protein [Lasiosphaeria hispida]|uniref:Ser/Thr protein phosphatase family protein n=1 Tax=Lasiosphaeria hispida TaxID=260671 RepID=A0AAJ0HKT1_9PEZI|nr:Ser/Thr protein phosphatase family protein [Lasiosphaeria hispida]